ncbi:MAG TPA: uroporphyrinogen decarboxylase family protein [Terriglobia bacterium]|nr:uroporphyrinogen decarboxylase family protein [Terriglobia bacterium]
MNSLERVQAVLAGRIPDRVPVCLHNFMMAAREAGIPMRRYRQNPKAIAEAHLRALEKYGHDCIMVDTDTTMLAEAMGAKSECAPDEPGRIVVPAINSLSEVGRLKVVDPESDARIPALLEGVRRIAEQVGTEVALRGNADQCAFDLACMVRGIESFLMELVTEPENPAIGRLLEICYQSHLAVHRALKKAGAHFTSLGDSLAGPDVVSPHTFDRFARPYEERLVKELAADGIFTVIHICGDTTKILNALAGYDSCGFELDYKTDARKAKETVGVRHVLFGNLDPSAVIARGTPGEVRNKTRELLRVWKPQGNFVLNAGCAIPPTTPPENIRALIAAAREEGIYH